MREKNRLTLYMGMFYLIVILLLGLIVITEKKDNILKPKIKEKIITYIEENYKEEKNNFKYTKLYKKNNCYTIKIFNKNNNNLYFIANYKNNKITDTYKKDYLEGKTLNTHIEKELNNELKEKLNNLENNYIKYNISYNTKLNNCSKPVKNKLLNNNYNIPIYTINVEITIDDNTMLSSTLTEINNYTKKLELNPKNYNITINNQKNITKSMNLIIEPAIIENDIVEIVSLINSNNFTTLETYNIKCKYLN